MDKNKYYVIGSILTVMGIPTGYYIADVSQEGVQNTAKHEGYKAKPYKDSGGVITQGNGSTIKPDGTKIKMTDKPISEKEALRYLRAHMHRHQKNLMHHSKMYVYLKLNTIYMPTSFISTALMPGLNLKC